MANPLQNYRILIVDADMEMAQVLKTVLRDMGFPDVYVARGGKDAISIMQTMNFDFIITEWNIQQIDGIKLLEFIRRHPDSPNPTIPIIMLTGRAEQVDVALARNYGVNEYIIKPFTAKSIYSRLERIIEQPRGFVVAKTFVGPDRRSGSRDNKPASFRERRKRNTLPQIKPKEVKKALRNDSDEPQIWLPDFSLKLKLGKNTRLDSVITPQIIEQSQAAIDAITNSSLGWIRDNLSELKQLYEVLISQYSPSDIKDDLSGIALTINSRAGTFGYGRAGEISYGLYVFIRNNLDVKNRTHHLIIKKHIEVLQVILGNHMCGDAGLIGEQIAAELKALINKYSK